MLDKAKRVLILGCSGSGKSTLTRLICDHYSLPAVHLDKHFWSPGWTTPSTEKWREKVIKLSNDDQWVMDGTYSDTFDIRFPLADLIIIVNLPRITCLYRVIMRIFKYSKKKRRPDIALGCDEKFNLNFYKYIWTYNQKELPQILDAIKTHECEEKVIFLSTNREVSTFVSDNISAKG